MNQPHNCVKAVSKSFADLEQEVAVNETFYEVRIGPTFFSYASSSYTTSTMTSASLYNVWFASEGFDLVMFAGESFYQILLHSVLNKIILISCGLASYYLFSTNHPRFI